MLGALHRILNFLTFYECIKYSGAAPAYGQGKRVKR
jgi:hypothetical protein